MRKILLGLVAAGLSVSAASAADYDGGNLTVVGTAPLGEIATFPSEEVTAYSNVTTFLGQAFPNGGSANQSGNGITRLVADDITPSGGAGESVVQVKFSVANLNTVAVSARARIRFWLADGAGGAPGTYYSVPAAVGFSFNPISFGPGVTVVTGTIAPNLFTMPGTTFWAGLTFDNNVGGTGATLAQLDNMGQGIFDPPTIGSSLDAAFQTTAAGSFFTTNNPAGSLFNFGGNPIANFGWEFTTPEPTSLALLALGGLVFARRR